MKTNKRGAGQHKNQETANKGRGKDDENMNEEKLHKGK